MYMNYKLALKTVAHSVYVKCTAIFLHMFQVSRGLSNT